jgi:hypothetical protein
VLTVTVLHENSMFSYRRDRLDEIRSRHAISRSTPTIDLQVEFEQYGHLFRIQTLFTRTGTARSKDLALKALKQMLKVKAMASKSLSIEENDGQIHVQTIGERMGIFGRDAKFLTWIVRFTNHVCFGRDSDALTLSELID